jgi:hypothetical protein
MNPPIIIVDIWDGSHLFVDLVNSRETEVVINWTSSYESEKYSGVAKPPSDGFFVIPPGDRLFCFPAADLNGQISAPGERFQKAMFGRPETTIEITPMTDSGWAELSKIINPSDLRVFGSVSFPAGKKAVGFECTEILFRNPVFIGKFTALGRTPWAQIDGTRFGDSCPAVNESSFALLRITKQMWPKLIPSVITCLAKRCSPIKSRSKSCLNTAKPKQVPILNGTWREWPELRRKNFKTLSAPGSFHFHE